MAIFSIFERAFHHFDLMDRMMNAVGVTERFKTLPGSANVLRRAAARCRQCKDAGGCQALLNTNESLDEAPDFCRNHDLFARLKREIEADQAAA